MRVHVISVAVLLLAVATCAKAQAAGAGAGGAIPIGPPEFCQIYQGILQSEASKISTPDLPADLQLRVNAVLENSPQGCADCDGLVFWLNKICLVSNLRAGLNQLSQIKAEADARATTTAAAPVSPTQ